MIRKLRTKIIVNNFVSVCVVFVIGLAVLFVIGYSRLNDERIVQLNNELNKTNWHDLTQSSVSGMVLAEYDVSSGTIIWRLKGDGVSMEDKQVDSMLRRIAVRSFSNGIIGTHVVYAKRTEGSLVRIALVDRSYNSRKDVKYAMYSLVALFVGAVLYLIISYSLARFALRPIELTWKRQKQFVADASHELKTPLSVIRANTDLVASHQNEKVSSQMQWIDNTLFEVERMTALVNDLLFLAKNDEGLKEQLDTVDLSDCVNTVALSQEALIYEKGKLFDYTVAPKLFVQGNAGQLKQLVVILLDNATKYSTGEGHISLTLASAPSIGGKIAELKVSNDCPPLTEEQLGHLFDRFYTVDQARDKARSGSGLGLAIAQTICENHGGQISAAYANGRITFTVQLALNRSNLLGK